MSKFSKLKHNIKKNEGYRNSTYNDQLNNFTIGYGHLINKTENFNLKRKYSKKYLNMSFEKDFQKTLNDFKKNYGKNKLQKNTQEVLIEMIFQLGIKNCLKFKKFNQSLKKKLPHMAALEMLNSRWYTQTPKRVERLINLLLE